MRGGTMKRLQRSETSIAESFNPLFCSGLGLRQRALSFRRHCKLVLSLGNKAPAHQPEQYGAHRADLHILDGQFIDETGD